MFNIIVIKYPYQIKPSIQCYLRGMAKWRPRPLRRGAYTTAPYRHARSVTHRSYQVSIDRLGLYERTWQCKRVMEEVRRRERAWWNAKAMVCWLKQVGCYRSNWSIQTGRELLFRSHDGRDGRDCQSWYWNATQCTGPSMQRLRS